jgi:hypothetical protein
MVGVRRLGGDPDLFAADRRAELGSVTTRPVEAVTVNSRPGRFGMQDRRRSRWASLFFYTAMGIAIIVLSRFMRDDEKDAPPAPADPEPPRQWRPKVPPLRKCCGTPDDQPHAPGWLRDRRARRAGRTRASQDENFRIEPLPRTCRTPAAIATPVQFRQTSIVLIKQWASKPSPPTT